MSSCGSYPRTAVARDGLGHDRGIERRARPGTGHGLHRLRSDGGQPARRNPPHGDESRAAAAAWPYADRARRRWDRAHRRSQRQESGAVAAHLRAGGGQRAGHSHAARTVSRFRPGTPQRRAHAQQRRVAPPDRLSRFPAGRRQVLHRELHDVEGVGEAPARGRRRHQLHRVQLSAAAGVRLSRPARPRSVHAADGRHRPVGQHHRRLRSDPENARARARTGSCGR